MGRGGARDYSQINFNKNAIPSFTKPRDHWGRKIVREEGRDVHDAKPKGETGDKEKQRGASEAYVTT